MAKNKAVNVSNYHVQYSDLTSQHWHKTSQPYAGGDHLITALEKNWQIDNCQVTRHWYAGMRSVRVYEFTLSKGDKTIVMPVLDNPYIERFILDEGINYSIAESAKVQ